MEPVRLIGTMMVRELRGLLVRIRHSSRTIGSRPCGADYWQIVGIGARMTPLEDEFTMMSCRGGVEVFSLTVK